MKFSAGKNLAALRRAAVAVADQAFDRRAVAAMGGVGIAALRAAKLNNRSIAGAVLNAEADAKDCGSDHVVESARQKAADQDRRLIAIEGERQAVQRRIEAAATVAELDSILSEFNLRGGVESLARDHS